MIIPNKPTSFLRQKNKTNHSSSRTNVIDEHPRLPVMSRWWHSHRAAATKVPMSSRPVEVDQRRREDSAGNNKVMQHEKMRGVLSCRNGTRRRATHGTVANGRRAAPRAGEA